MSVKNKKQFGIWMDSQHATIVGRDQLNSGVFVVLSHEQNNDNSIHSSEHTSNNAERSSQLKFFKGITSHMQNIEELHVTGTGQVQEQFIHYLTETPQFKNTIAKQSTSNKMSDEKLIEFISEKFNQQ